MEGYPDSKAPCYVFDSSSLIEIEKNHGGLNHLSDSPGKWFVVPSKVAREVSGEGAPVDTKNWLKSGKWAEFNVDSERRLFMKIRVQEALSDADIQGIVIAYHRGATYVVEEKLATLVAKRLGVRTVKAAEFLNEVKPHLPGFE